MAPVAGMVIQGIVVRRPGGPALLEEIILDPPGPGEVRVRIAATGVCHSDLHTKEGNFGTDFPYLLGHEAAGVIEDVGEGVSPSRVGEPVVLSWRAHCGECRFCVAGRAAFCASPVVAGSRMRTLDGLTLGRVLGLGTFATHTVVASGQAIPMANDLPAEATCLIGCAVATGVGSALYAADVSPGSSVAVFGCGAVGISVIQGARLAGASRIFAVDPVPERLEWAKRFGATDLINPAEGSAPKQIKKRTGTGVAFAFDAVGLPESLTDAMASCDLGGICVLIGVPAPKAQLELSLARTFYSRVQIRSTFYGDCLPSEEFPKLARLYREGSLELDKLVTSKISLDAVDSAFAAMKRGEGLRAVIVFP